MVFEKVKNIITEQLGIDEKDVKLESACIEDLGEKGFFIDVEEIDFDSNYQITMRIYKD